MIQSCTLIPLMAAAAVPEATRAVLHLRAGLRDAWRNSGVLPKESNRPPTQRLARALWELIAGHPWTEGPSSDDVQGLPIWISAYAASEEQIVDILAELNARSSYGRCLPRLTRSERNFLVRSLPCWTFFCIKDRNVEMVSPLLRAMRQMGLGGHEEFEEGIEFLLDQQRLEGYFGYHDMAIHLASQQGQSDLDVQREVTLRMTAGCVWTLLDCLFPECGVFG